MMKQEQYEPNTVTRSKIPSFETFRKEILKIYPEGNLLLAYEKLIHLITQVKTCEDGRPITYQLIMDKYSDHIRSWNMVFGRRDPRYWGKDAEEKRKTIWDFIELGWYEREFLTSVGDDERSSYLFGGFSISYLKKRLEEFKRRIKDETTKK